MKRAIPWISLTMWFVFGIWFVGSGDPRIADGVLSDDEMTTEEKILGAIHLLLSFATVGIAAFRAYGSGSKFWCFGSIFFWPISYVYCLAVNRDR